MNTILEKDYKVLRFVSKKSRTYKSISKRFGNSAYTRLKRIVDIGYALPDNGVEMWDIPTKDSSMYSVTEEGIKYIEYHKETKLAELRALIIKDILIPIGVAALTTLILDMLKRMLL